MTNDTKAAAAERLRRWAEDQFSCSMAQVAEDRKTLASDWLAKHLPDDDEPIDATWLYSQWSPSFDLVAYVEFAITCFTWAVIRNGRVTIGIGLVQLPHIATRGQLRKLLELLQ